MECLLIKVSRKKNNKIILLAPSIEKDIPFNVATLSYFVGNVNQTNPKTLYMRTHGQVAVEGMQITALPPTVRRAQMNHNSAGNAIVNSKPNSSTEVKDQFIRARAHARAGDFEYVKDGVRLYSVEAIDVAKYKNSVGQLVAIAESERQTPITEFIDMISKAVENSQLKKIHVLPSLLTP